MVGDLEDPASPERAMRGVDAALSSQALDAKVGYLVYSSVGGAEGERPMELPVLPDRLARPCCVWTGWRG